jgi:hypothetical protein
MNKQLAIEITGGLGNPSKMPGLSYGLPAAECKTGSKLRKQSGTVCSNCYACKGMYRFNNVQRAQYKRLDSIGNPLWVDAMVSLIGKQSFFRWHDSGDIQSIDHLARIVEVCKRTPGTKHWIPTKEIKLIKEAVDLGMLDGVKNLVIRISAFKIDSPRLKGLNHPVVKTSRSITKNDGDKKTRVCSAYKRGNVCGDCRACWQGFTDIAYMMH